MNTKLNVLLAKTDHLAGQYKKMLEEYVKFFKNSQGAFKGERKTYTPKAGTIDQPNERSNKLVVTTVKEKLDYLQDNTEEYINALFGQEATNASGVAKIDLIVDDFNFGRLSTLELLRLKSLLEYGTFKELYENLPTRTEDQLWDKSIDEMYRDREVYATPMATGVSKSIQKESYIISDPNIEKLSDKSSYTPVVATKDTIFELGDWTWQRYSGECSHRERAGMLARRSKLLTAVIEAIKTANDVEAVESEMTAYKLFSYLHEGTL